MMEEYMTAIRHPSITWIRREFHYFRSKLPEKAAFVAKIFAAVAHFSQT
jgi:hypothetical protein